MTDFEDYEKKDESTDDLIDNDEVSPEEEGFLKGYNSDEPDSEDDESDDESEKESKDEDSKL